MLHCECGREIYTPEDAQRYLGVSRLILNRYRIDGWLRPMGESGRGWLYSKNGLDECVVLLDKDRRDKEVEYA